MSENQSRRTMLWKLRRRPRSHRGPPTLQQPPSSQPGTSSRSTNDAENQGLELPGYVYDEQLGRYFRIPPGGGPAAVALKSAHPSRSGSNREVGKSPPPASPTNPSPIRRGRIPHPVLDVRDREHGLGALHDPRCILRVLAACWLCHPLPRRERVHLHPRVSPPTTHVGEIEHLVTSRDQSVVAVVNRRGGLRFLDCFAIVERSPKRPARRCQGNAASGVSPEDMGNAGPAPALEVVRLRDISQVYRRPLAALCWLRLPSNDPALLTCMNGTGGREAVAQIFLAVAAAGADHREDDVEFPEELHPTFVVGRGAVFACAHSSTGPATLGDCDGDSDGLLAFGTEGGVTVTSATGGRVARLPVGSVGEHVPCLQFATDGRALFAGTSRGVLHGWRLRRRRTDGAAVLTPFLRVTVFGVAPLVCLQVLDSRHRELVVAAHGHKLAAVDAEDGRVVRRYGGHVNRNGSLQCWLSEEVDVLCATGQDGVTRLWRLTGPDYLSPLTEYAAPVRLGEPDEWEQPRSVFRGPRLPVCSLPCLVVGHSGGLDLHHF